MTKPHIEDGAFECVTADGRNDPFGPDEKVELRRYGGGTYATARIEAPFWMFRFEKGKRYRIKVEEVKEFTMNHETKPHEYILHDRGGAPVARVSSAGCHDTPPEINGTQGVCLFINADTSGAAVSWRHVASVGLSKDGEPILGITAKGGEHIVLTVADLKNLLGN